MHDSITHMHMCTCAHAVRLYINLQFREAKVEDRESEEVGKKKEDNKRKDEGTPEAGDYN